MPTPSPAEAGPAFAERVVAWQRRHGRNDLPWQNTRDPYLVWLSEIMLQQTQVATAAPYYERFLRRFGDVAALAAASADDVLALWSGLGYYSRARNLHRCAQVVVAEHGGVFPRTSAELMQLPGIGRSTAAAIAAFCFGERVAILDGNVKRVLTRVLGFGGDLAEAAAERTLWARATALLPERGTARYTQGLMDLGATLCTARQPACAICPLRGACVAERDGAQASYPVKTRRLVRTQRESVWLWLAWRGSVWLEARPARGIWSGLWSLPEFATSAQFERLVHAWPGSGEALPSFIHTLTHLDWTLHPTRWTLPARTGAGARAEVTAALPPGRWFTLDEALAAGLPAPLRRLLEAA
jgi:A/G-specific adenine glycosylase